MALLGVALASLVLSAALTGALRRYALARQILDVPNQRSSHKVPTPRGGGMAIVLVVLVALVGATAWGALPLGTGLGLAGAGAVVAAVGFADDHGHIAARWRLLAHFSAAGWGLAWLGGLPGLTFFGWDLHLGLAGSALAVVALVWLLNLYNFMDGIDGIAGVEAISACLGAALAAHLSGAPAPMIALPVWLAAASAGFLAWNFPPAKIFMGDAGSGFVGLLLGLLALHAAHANPSLVWTWLILLGVFVVDATVTLLRRLARGEKAHEAHHCHAYQYASRRLGGHRPVTLAVAAVNVLWLLPLAIAVALGWLDGALGLLVAYAPLTALALRLKAGDAEHQEV